MTNTLTRIARQHPAVFLLGGIAAGWAIAALVVGAVIAVGAFLLGAL